jgi:hypothetical protein
MLTRQLRRQKVTPREAFAGRDRLRYGRRDAAAGAAATGILIPTHYQNVTAVCIFVTHAIEAYRA